MRILIALAVTATVALALLWGLGRDVGPKDAGRSEPRLDDPAPDAGVSGGSPTALEGVAEAAADRGAGRGEAPAAAREAADPEEDAETWPGLIELEVLDAATRAPLEDVWVQEEPRQGGVRSVKGGVLRPFGSPLVEGDSPVQFRWPAGGSARVCRALVFVDGHAHGVASVNVARGGRYQVLLERACSLEVVLGGARARRAWVGVREADTGDERFFKAVPTTSPTKIEGLAPGRYVVTAEIEGRDDFAAQEVTLSAAIPGEVNLFLSQGEESAPLRLVVEVPVDSAPGEDTLVSYRIDAFERDEQATFPLVFDPAEARRFGAYDRYTFVTDPVAFGLGQVWIDDLLVDERFVHTAERPATVVLRAMEPTEFEFVCVDAVTGERTPHTRGEVGVVVHDTVRGGEDLTAASPGRFIAPLRGANVRIGVESAHGYLDTYVTASPRQGEVVEVLMEPIPSILVGMVRGGRGAGAGDPVPWPAGFEPVLSRSDAPDAEFRFEYEGDGVRLWVDRQSFWELRLPDLPGYKSGQTTDVWFGEDTELGRKPVGLEVE